MRGNNIIMFMRIGGMGAAVLLMSACGEISEVTAPEVAASFDLVGDDGEPPVDEHCSEEHPERCETANGRLTGGGTDISVGGAKVSKGLTIHCDVTLTNNLNVTWDDNGRQRWHIQKENLVFITCLDDPAYDPFPPDAPVDTFIGRAIGRLNNEWGSITDFRFIDDGEPGTSDEAYMTVYAVGQGPGQVAAGSEVVVLQVGGVINGGNLQAHYDQPHGSGRGGS